MLYNSKLTLHICVIIHAQKPIDEWVLRFQTTKVVIGIRFSQNFITSPYASAHFDQSTHQISV